MKALYLLAICLILSSGSIVRSQPTSPPATITITSPAAGGTFLGLWVAAIKQTVDGDVYYPVNYEYTTDKGSSWLPIMEFTGSGKATLGDVYWQPVPNIDAPAVQVRIRDAQGAMGVSGVFSIKAVPQVQSVRVNNNKFPVPVNSDVLIEWTAVGKPTPFDIDYVVNDFATYQIAYQLDSTKRSLIWHTPSEPVGNVVLRVQALSGGTASVGPFEINFVSEVREDAASDRALSVFPNPASSKITITFSDVLFEQNSSAVHVTMTDIAGRIVLEQVLTALSTSFDLDVSSLESGKYLLTLSTGDCEVAKKITIVR